MTRAEYRRLDWQSQDEAFYEYIDQYLADEGLPSFEEQGDYSHVDLGQLKSDFLTSLA